MSNFSFRTRQPSTARRDLPCTQIQSAQLKNDMINPFSKLNSRDIMKINERFRNLKERLFLKDKIIQDKIQLVQALNFFHQKKIDVFNQNLNSKNYKMTALQKKCDQMFEINKE